MDLTLQQGDTHYLEAVITREDQNGVDQPVPLPTGTKLWWTAKTKKTDPDTAAVIRKGTTNAGLTGIDVTGTATGQCVVTLAPADTANVGKGTVFLHWDMQLLELDGTLTTVNKGRLALTEEVTNASS